MHMNYVRFEVFTAVTFKNGVFWDVMPCGRVMHAASVASYCYVPSSPILVTLMMEELSSSKTLVLTRATRCNIPKDANLHIWTKYILSYSHWRPNYATKISIKAVTENSKILYKTHTRAEHVPRCSLLFPLTHAHFCSEGILGKQICICTTCQADSMHVLHRKSSYEYNFIMSHFIGQGLSVITSVSSCSVTKLG
jgi:hypothetical protein